jgi:hypoxanthine phosphoribosyltransferase
MFLDGHHFQVFIREQEIRQAVGRLAAAISRDYEGKNPVLLAILNGSFIFAADLIRELSIEAEISFIRLSSYKKFKSSGEIRELIGLESSLSGREIIIVEDIVDTGRTLGHVLREFEKEGAKSVAVAALLHKPEAGLEAINLNYVGFSIPDRFVVGYGLDFNGMGRNLKDIYQLV